jgi:hypothetical protein
LQNTIAVNNLIAQMGPEAQIIAHAMQQYGLVLADIGSAMYITGTSSAKSASNTETLTWNMDDVLDLHSLTAGMFDVVDLTPRVTGLSANSGAPGSTITITGQNFSGSAGHLSVYFGTIQSSQVTYISDTQITAVVPAGTGSVDVTVQSGVVESDDISSNPNANAKGAIFGYGTSATSSADLFTLSGGGAQTVSGTNSHDSFATSTVLNGATDVLTIVVKDTTGAGITGLASNAFTFGLAGGTSAGTFGAVSETGTPGTYTVTFTGTTVGTQSTLIVTVSGVTLSQHPGIMVVAPAFAVIGPSGAIAAATGYDRPSITWNSFTGADHYMLVVTDKTTNTTAFSVASTGGTSYVPTLAQALTPGHNFMTTVSAMSAANVKLGSATQTFALAALAMPTGLTPTGTIAAASGFDRPTFGWNAVAGADHYYVVVMDNTTNKQAFAVNNITGTSYATTNVQALTPGHKYTFTVYADSTNNKGNVKSTQTFTLAALTAPTGLAPTGTIAAAAGFDRPTFRWNAVAGADHYYLLVMDNNTNSQAFAAANIAGTSYTPTAAQALTPGHKYTFTVYADSTNNKASPRTTQTFALAALTAPTGLSPTGTIAASAGYDQPTFRWNAVVGADHYYLAVTDNTTNTLAFAVANITATSYTTTTAQALTPGHKYTFTVYADSTNNKVSPRTAQAFTLATYPATILSGPVGTITNTTPTFAWGAVTGADRYVLNVVDSTTGATVLNVTVTGALSFTPTTPLIRGHKYTWRVSAVSTNGKFAPWSASQIFTIS